jgi:hypothetical protein
MALLAVSIIGTFIGTVLAVEAKAWAPHLSARLLRATIDRFPQGIDEEMRGRWSEEIEADLASYADRPLGGLIFALRLRRRGGKALAAELALQAALDSGAGTPADDDEAILREKVIWVKTKSGSVQLRIDAGVGTPDLRHGTILSGPAGRQMTLEELPPDILKAIADAADLHRVRAITTEKDMRSL